LAEEAGLVSRPGSPQRRPHLASPKLTYTQRRTTANNTTIPTIWNPAYDTDSAPLTSTRKQAEVVRLALGEGLLDLRQPLHDPALAWADMGRTHDATYIDALRTGRPRALAESQWFTWSPAFANALALIWTGHLTASRLALESGLVLHPVSGAHHAQYAHGAAFCSLNFLVGASTALLDSGRVERVLMLDLDAHYGDGTDALTMAEPRIMHFDIYGGHRLERTQRGVWAGVRNARDYMRLLQTELPRLLDRQPDLVQWQAGVDPFEDDDVGGIPGMTADCLRERDLFVLNALAARQMPTVICFAGGYSSSCVALHCQTVRSAAAAVSRWSRGNG
jgi:acetoin utilization deacetylase AcuC-like enzyme